VSANAAVLPNDIVNANISAVINNVIRRFIFSHPLSLCPNQCKKRATDHPLRWVG
jgi:hypothetical protein